MQFYIHTTSDALSPFYKLPALDPDVLSTDLATTVMALDKGAPHDAMIGFVKCVLHPSPIPASIVFSTSLPLPATESRRVDPEQPFYTRAHKLPVPLALHTRMRALL